MSSMYVKFITTTYERMQQNAVPLKAGQIIALSDSLGYYYDMHLNNDPTQEVVRFPATGHLEVSAVPKAEEAIAGVMYVVKDGDASGVYIRKDNVVDGATQATMMCIASMRLDEFGIEVSADEINHLEGIESNVQDQLDSKVEFQPDDSDNVDIETNEDENISKIFIATYDETTYDEIVKAYEAGKIVSLIIPLEDRTVMASLTMPNAIGDSGYNFTFAGDENGTSHYANIDYASKKWVYWFCDYYRLISDSLTLGNTAASEHIKRKAEIKKITTSYKKEDIAANGKYKLREKGFYIFGGSDYDLNLCDASDNTIGKTKALVVIVFCTEARNDGTFDVYVMQNYKEGSIVSMPSMDGMPYDNFTKNHYIHNTNTSKSAYVYYMRQNEV